MDSVKRVVVNTGAQYVRSIINILLSLYSTRLVLEALGKSDYGIYALVGGVVSMVGFLTNAMTITTQRHLSFAFGRGNQERIRLIFSNSLMLHFLICIVLIGVFSGIGPWLFSCVLNIDENRQQIAVYVYFTMMLVLLCTFIMTPYRALLVAHENIVFISIVDVLDGVMKVGMVLFLKVLPTDRLLTYAWMMVLIMFFNLALYSFYDKRHYSETTLLPKIRDWHASIVRQLTSFAGWTTYSIGCIIGRVQGLAIILNHFFGTIINSAYGIAIQVSGATMFVSEAVLTALRPQIVKAEGNGDHEQMIELSERASKYAFILLSFVCIPLIIEMDSILSFWLPIVPDNAVLFCRFILATSLVDQITIGLGTANQAMGKIRNYSLCINTIKIITLPIAWIILVRHGRVETIMWVLIGLEFFGALMRLPFLKQSAGLSISHFVSKAILPAIPQLIVAVIIGTVETRLFIFPFRFLVTGIVCVLFASITTWFLSFDVKERNLIKKMVKVRLHK